MVASPAWLFHRLTALTLLVAWLSLAVQVKLLIGAQGLAPIAPLLAAVSESGQAGFWQLPTLMWWVNSDGALVAGTAVGAILATCALLGVAPRACLAASAPLYLSYAVGGQAFLSFQWDSLAVEMAILAALLPADDRDPIARWLVRLLLFKVMLESGVAKWQSHLGDWQDGSAMAHYYLTAPLPAGLGWRFHHLPAWWHHFESHWTLFFELVVPFFIFAGRKPRLLALVIFLTFLVINTATANYGFFTLQAAALCVMLLDDRDAARLLRRPAPPKRTPPTAWRALVGTYAAVWLTLSTTGGLSRFAGVDILPAAQQAARPLRIANNYHLFGHITRSRIEPELQTWDGSTWTAQHLYYKPGPLDRRPPYVAPHQPRVDFRLWFYGLSYQRGMPRDVENLIRRLCQEPAVVQSLFTQPLPEHPEAVRVVFWAYSYTAPDVATRDWWVRTEQASTQPITCSQLAQGLRSEAPGALQAGLEPLGRVRATDPNGGIVAAAADRSAQ